jgi:hypothetical protein
MLNDIDTDVVTDDTIYQQALEDWLKVLSTLWTAYDKPVDPVRFALYSDMLRKIPLGLLEQAVERVVSEHVYNSVPTVAEVWVAVRKELHNPFDLDQAIERWKEALWYRAVYRWDDVARSVAAETG